MTLAIENTTLYLTDHYNGYLIALDTDDGETVWRRKFECNTSIPTIHDGTIYMGCYEHLYAVDAQENEVQWKFTTNAPVRSAPAVLDNTIYVTNDGGVLYAVEAEKPKERWHINEKDKKLLSPVVADGTVYVTGYQPLELFSERQVIAIDAETGVDQWRYEGQGLTSPAIVDETLYVGAARFSESNEKTGAIVAIDAEDGTRNWQLQTSSPTSPPVIADGVIYTVREDGKLSARNLEDRSQRWQFQTRDSVIDFGLSFYDPGSWLDKKRPSLPTIANGTVYVGGGSGLYAIGDDSSVLSTFTLPFRESIFAPEDTIAGLGGLFGISYGGAKSYQRLSSTGEEKSDNTKRQDAIEAAEIAQEEGDDAREGSDYGRAIAAYETATEAYQTALGLMDADDESREKIETELATVEKTLQELRDHTEKITEITEQLRTADKNLQTAITNHLEGQKTVPKSCYRQAAIGYEEAIDSLQEDRVQLFDDGGIEIHRDTSLASAPKRVLEEPEWWTEKSSNDDTVDIASREDMNEVSQETLDSMHPVIRMLVKAWWNDEIETVIEDISEIESRHRISTSELERLK
jgi:outer membrane protein assembly factor BamB/molybdopterin converting factor small subunit